MSKNKTLSLNLRKDDWKALSIAALEMEMPKNEFVRYAVDKVIREELGDEGITVDYVHTHAGDVSEESEHTRTD